MNTARIALAALVVAGGATLGVVAGRAGGGEPTGDTVLQVRAVTVPTWDCPGGEPSGTLAQGDRIQLTGVDPTGGWLQLRDPLDLGRRVWVDRAVIDPDQDVDDLPATDCPDRVAPGEAPVVTTTTPTAPGTGATTTSPSTTTPGPSTSAASGPGRTTTTSRSPSPTPGPTTAPDTTAPVVGTVVKSSNTVYENQPAVCPGQAFTVAVRATVNDAGGVASVVVRWSVNGRSGELAASREGSEYSATVGPFDESTIPQNPGVDTLTITFRATDQAGNVGTASTSVQFYDCTFF